MTPSWPKIDDDKQTFWVMLIALFLAWIVFRSVTVYPSLIRGDGLIRLSGADSYFHLRHAEYSREHFPSVLRRDDMAKYPGVERGLNQGLYDMTIAGLSLLSFGLLTPKMVLLVISPVTSGIGFVLLAAWLWKRCDPWCAVLFGTFVVAYPGPLKQIAGLGNGDHHAFEVMLFIALVLSLHESLRPERGILWVTLPAAILYSFFLSWAGAPLHLFFVGLCFYLIAFAEQTREEAKLLAQKGILFGALTVALPVLTKFVFPQMILWREAYDIFLAGGVALTFGYLNLILLSSRLPSKAKWPTALILLASLPFLVQLYEPAADAFSSFVSPRASTISEHGVISIRLLVAFYGIGWLCLLITPLILAHRRKLTKFLIPATYGLGIVLFWIKTKDFNYYGPPVVAAFTAFGLRQLPWKKWTGPLLAVLLVLPFLPMKLPAAPWQPPFKARGTVLHTDGMEQACRWLRDFKHGPGKEQTYGVIAPWDLGSLIAQLAETPVGWSQTHSKTLARLFYSDDPEDVYQKRATGERPHRFLLLPSRNLEEKFGTELIVAGKKPGQVYRPGPQFDYQDQTFNLPAPNDNFQALLIVRLFNQLGRDLGRYRLVYESPQQVVRTVKLATNLKSYMFTSLEVTPEEAKALRPVFSRKNAVIETSRGLLVNPFLGQDVRIFEMVPGAMLVGKTKPHTRVGAFLSVSFEHTSTPHVITWKDYADSEGNFALRVPFPTTRGRLYPVEGSIKINGAYRFDIGGQVTEVEVSEDDVQSEARVDVVFSETSPWHEK